MKYIVVKSQVSVLNLPSGETGGMRVAVGHLKVEFPLAIDVIAQVVHRGLAALVTAMHRPPILFSTAEGKDIRETLGTTKTELDPGEYEACCKELDNASVDSVDVDLVGRES